MPRARPHDREAAYWGPYDSEAELPNSSGATAHSQQLTPGDTAYVFGSGLYVCVDASQDGAAWDLLMRAASQVTEAKHFVRADVGSVATAGSSGTFDAAAAAEFIRRSCANDETIEAIHLHVEVGGGAGTALSFDVFRYRPSTGVHTFVGNVALSGAQSNNAIDITVPSGDAATILAGDYLKCQGVGTLTLDGSAGITIDAHFAERS